MPRNFPAASIASGALCKGGNPHICESCASEGATCCSLAPGTEDHCFPLSRPEWERMVEWCEHIGGFAESPNSPAFMQNMRALFPGEEQDLKRLVPGHAWHMRLAVNEKGDCVFLGNEGCRLPREVRPWYCRIFPFWVRNGRVTIFTANSCLAFLQARAVQPALELFGLSEKDILRLYGQLRLSWGLTLPTGRGA